MADRKRHTLLRMLLCSHEPSRELSRSKPSPPADLQVVNPEGRTRLSAGKLPFKRLTKLLGTKTRLATKLLSKARRSIFPRSALSRNIYLEQAARVSSSSIGPPDDFIPSAISLAITNQVVLGSSASIESVEEPLEWIRHPAKENTDGVSIMTSCNPGKPILKSSTGASVLQENLHTADAHTIANTSLNILMAFKRSKLKTRSSTGSLHSRLERYDLSRPPPSQDKTWESLSSFETAADAKIWQASRLRCHCEPGCTCRILEQYSMNKFSGNFGISAGSAEERSSPTVRFAHVDVYPIPGIEESDDDGSSTGDYDWLDETEPTVDQYGDAILDLEMDSVDEDATAPENS